MLVKLQHNCSSNKIYFPFRYETDEGGPDTPFIPVDDADDSEFPQQTCYEDQATQTDDEVDDCDEDDEEEDSYCSFNGYGRFAPLSFNVTTGQFGQQMQHEKEMYL